MKRRCYHFNQLVWLRSDARSNACDTQLWAGDPSGVPVSWMKPLATTSIRSPDSCAFQPGLLGSRDRFEHGDMAGEILLPICFPDKAPLFWGPQRARVALPLNRLLTRAAPNR